MRAALARLGGGLLSSSGVFGAAVFWLLSFKILAHWLGPAGVGLFSQLKQFAQTATLAATYGGTNVVVQGLATRSDEEARAQFRSMASRLMGVAGFGVVMLMLTAAPFFAQLILSSAAPELVTALRWLALAVLLNIVATYMLGVLNGYRSHAYFALAQIAGPAALAIFLAVAWRAGALPSAFALVAAFVLCFGVTCVVGTVGVLRLCGAGNGKLTGKWPAEQGAEVVRFALSSMVAALSTVAAILIIKSWIIEAKGLTFAGLFDAGWTLTFNYTTLFLTACNTMYLPLLAAATGPKQQKAYMLKAAYLVLGTSLLICYAMVLWRSPLIHLLYSPQFEGSGRVLSVLAIAVLFRGVSWVYGTMLLATRKSRVLMVSELAMNMALLVTTRFALDRYGTLESLGWAFVLPHFLYLAFVIEYLRLKNPLMCRRHIWPLLGVGILPLFYLAAVPAEGSWSNIAFARQCCMVIGLIVTFATYRAFRKVTL